jgi:hypothetical protein
MTAQTAPTPALVAKIKKLMNLSRDGAASENEMELARTHAQRLMMEHNITLATVEAADTSARSTITRSKETTKGRAMYDWQMYLMYSIARTNFCMVMADHSWTGRRWRRTGFQVIGREENTVATLTTFDYLVTTLERMARDYVGGDHRQLMSTQAMSFKAGGSERLQSRIQKQHQEMMAAQRAEADKARASSSNALVPIMEDFAEAEECANEDFRLGVASGTTAARRYKDKVRQDAWSAAMKACRDLDTQDKVILAQAAHEAAQQALAGTGHEGMAQGLAKDAVIQITAKPERESSRRYRSYTASQPRRDYTAFREGQAAGDRISLARQVDAAAVKRIG